MDRSCRRHLLEFTDAAQNSQERQMPLHLALREKRIGALGSNEPRIRAMLAQ